MFHLIWTIICGAIIGAVAAKFMSAKTTFWMNVVMGILGSFVGDFLFSLVGVYTTGIGNFITSVIGACVVLWVGNKFFGNKA